MRPRGIHRVLPLVAASLALVAGAKDQDEPPKSTEPAASHWKEAAGSYRITLGAARPVPLVFRDEPALKWTNPERRTDDGAVFLWTDRGRPEVAASFYRYKSAGRVLEDHEFISLSTFPLAAKHDGQPVWTPTAGNVVPTPIPDAPEPAKTPSERLRQMRGLAREFRASFNNPPDLSEIRLLTQPIYRFETEGKRADLLDGALFAFVHTTDPEVLLTIEARPAGEGGPMKWHYALARMSLVNLRVHHKDREVWSALWVNPTTDNSQPYWVRSIPAGP